MTPAIDSQEGRARVATLVDLIFSWLLNWPALGLAHRRLTAAGTLDVDGTAVSPMAILRRLRWPSGR